MMTDPIADMLTRIRNAFAAQKQSVDIPYSKMKYALAAILVREGYFERVEPAANKLTFRLVLRYNGKKQGSVRTIDRVSKPGRRVYVAKDKIPTVLNGLGVAVLSTSQGLLTSREAKKVGIGGELICVVA